MRFLSGAYRPVGWIVVVMSALIAVRMAAVLAATPSQYWLEEFVPLTRGEAGGTVIPADGLTGLIDDPALARSLIGDCIAESASPLSEVRDECFSAISYGLAASPASSELWFALARYYVAIGALDERLAGALEASYATGPREGWIAAERLPFALRMVEFLPDSLISEIGRDISLVVSNRQLATPLIEAYIANPFLRVSSWPVIEQFATFDEQERLIAWIGQAL